MDAPRITRRQAAPPAAAKPAPRARRGQARDFNVRNHGAAGDGRTLDTAAFQRAIDAAAAATGRARVLVPGGRRYLIGSLELKGAIDFHLADDAELFISTDRADYPGESVVFSADGAQGLRLSGTGSINGRAKEFMSGFDANDEWWLPKGWRPRLFQIVACRDLEIRDFTFRSAPAWGLHLLGCERVLVENLIIRNDLDVPNCDGIGPDHSRDVEIRKCDIICGDDGVVIKATRQSEDFGPSANITVEDCVFETQDSALKIGTETTHDVHHIRIRRCQVRSSCRSFNIQLRDEGSVHDVDVSDITFSCRYHSAPWWGRGEAFSLTAVPRTPQSKLGQIRDVRLRNFTGRAENSGRVQGCAQSRPQNIVLENIALTLDRWTKYPGAVFDNRPTTALTALEPHPTPAFSLREADNVALRGCRVAWGKHVPDYFTHALEAEKTTGLALTRFAGEAAHPKRDAAVVVR
jgi:polygalacturonase